MRYICVILVLLSFVHVAIAQQFNTNPMDSGGLLLPEQAAYRVTFYDLDVSIDPVERSLDGTLRVVADVVHPMEWLVLDLDTVFIVHGTYDHIGSRAQTERRGGRIWIQLERVYQPGDRLERTIRYSGIPRVAANPPWSGGFTWSQTSTGEPWISVSCQTQGADIWWPVKDHPSDRPDSVAVNITVPAGLVAASNGRLRGVKETDKTTTWSWFMSVPVNPYNVSVNIAPYEVISDTYTSVTGEEVETIFWVLPEDVERGKNLFPQFIEQMRFLEEIIGPFPFRSEKYGIVHTPYLGMEHSTIIAYGAGFRDGALFGQHSDYDDLMQHELAHEWWGNLVSVADWKDFWIHEGFGTYMQALYTEHRRGKQAYLDIMRHFRRMIDNRAPMAPRESRTAGEMYQGRDVYYKGASVLHSMRFLLGDEVFFTLLRRFAYPTPEMESWTDGSAQRYATTEEFRFMAERLHGQSLKWLFEVYMYQPHLPELKMTRDGNRLLFEWITPDALPFNMPIEVIIGSNRTRLNFSNNKATIGIKGNPEISIDPDSWVLKK